MNLEIFKIDESKEGLIPLFEGLKAGFPSPAADFAEIAIDLNRELVRNPDATFYARVKGSSMKDAGISEGDVLIIDRSLEPKDKQVAVCFIDGDFTVKRLKIQKDAIFLMPENVDFEPIKVTTENQFIVWGVVTFIIKKMNF